AGQHCAGGPLTLSAEALEWLVSYPWPGNVRQLSNVLKLLALTCDGGVVGAGDLPKEVRAGRTAAARRDGGAADAALASLRGASDTAQRARILEALRECGWTVAEAARRLGISRATLHRRMREYGLARPAG
ncbi:MAG: helix-turn-helix domain-containing protein, partial [Sphingomonadaceae bacterium]|nr:helix-turn-helix domain-containing protein [Sphingomonadaceae bacterium]